MCLQAVRTSYLLYARVPFIFYLYSKRPCVWLIVYSHTFPCLAVIAMTAMGVFS